MVLYLLAAVINLFKAPPPPPRTILAPVFVPPMFMLRWATAGSTSRWRTASGDSATNPITPLMAYFAMVVVFAKKYDDTRDRNAGIHHASIPASVS